MVATSATRDATNRDEFFAMTKEHPRRRGRGDLRRRGGPAVVHRRGRRPRAGRRAVRGRRHRRRVDRAGRRHLGRQAGRDHRRAVGGHRLCADHRAVPAERSAVGRRRSRGRGRSPRETLAPAFDPCRSPKRGRGSVSPAPSPHCPRWRRVCRSTTPNARICPAFRAPRSAERRSGCLLPPKKSAPSNPVIHPGRVDVIGGGAIIVDVLAERARRDARISAELLVSEHDILDGIALSLR